MNFNLTHRPRRLRNNPLLRELVKEKHLNHTDLVLPVFVTDQSDTPEKIDSMPEVFRWPLNLLTNKIKEWQGSRNQYFCNFPTNSRRKKEFPRL
jgi:porphobilinogen synthase